MKTIRSCAAVVAVTLLTFGATVHVAHAGPPHYIVRGTEGYCTGGGTACSVYKGNFWKTFVDVEGPPTGAHSGTPASLKLGCWHAYPKGGDRLLDRGVVTLAHVTKPVGTAAIIGTATDDNTPNIVHMAINFNRTLHGRWPDQRDGVPGKCPQRHHHEDPDQ